MGESLRVIGKFRQKMRYLSGIKDFTYSINKNVILERHILDTYRVGTRNFLHALMLAHIMRFIKMKGMWK